MKKGKNCTLCGDSIKTEYYPMKEWNVDGLICSNCYSKKIAEYYPGDHTRVNLSKE